MKQRFPDREFYIGLDTALLIGNPAVLATGLLLIPGALILAILLPGNKVLPFVDLASLVFLIPMAAPYLQKTSSACLFRGWSWSRSSSMPERASPRCTRPRPIWWNVSLPEGVSATTELANLVGGATTPLGWLLIKLASIFA